ncbi:aminodeoxychorismate synthase component I [Alteromonas sp. 1_MG-2023]|uniref:aminodeoxychorismate synthase component I n=1 Tax=Alteromonas sp. 1_MG-2023 TaxID=3062669 RepID=UPI0026E3B67E|nr:aminodeoxychorismate synthase component I [Alteromonas sp. 1_MG-2023]MDO6565904.1 aminodeoxychorismate synthase component I [Alteromonas sp. 1_MG-2023]
MSATSTISITPINTTPSLCLNDIFEGIAHKAGAVLLDTCGSTKSNGRYNIMVWEPHATVTAKHGGAVQVKINSDCASNSICDNSSSDVSEADIKSNSNKRGSETFSTRLAPFEAVKQYLHNPVAKLEIPEQYQSLAKQLPFIVGVAGFAGYDTGRYYEQLPENTPNTYSTPDFSVGLYLSSLIEDTVTGVIYFCSANGETTPPYFVTQPTIGFIGNTDAADHINLAAKGGKDAKSPKDVKEAQGEDTYKTPFSLTGDWQSNLTKDAYLTCIEKIHRYLIAGDCYQVNMAQRFTAPYSGDCWPAYCALRQSNQAPFSAYIQLENSTILSISPERFISVKNGVVETKPIKGTRPRFADKAEDDNSAQSLLDAPKDRAENLMIVDLLRNDLSKHCKPHSVKVPELFALESYEAVHHLVSTVVGELSENATPLDLLASSFPGGSITGAPKIRAMEIIDELEVHRRNIYCGSIFYMGFREDMDSSICIRTLLAENNLLHCWAGGGIVLDSVASEEYKETLDKVSKILPVLSSRFGVDCEQN